MGEPKHRHERHKEISKFSKPNAMVFTASQLTVMTYFPLAVFLETQNNLYGLQI